MSMHRRQRPLGLMALLAIVSTVRVTDGQEPPVTVLQGEIELARLIDLVSERLGLNVEYDAGELSEQVTLRLGAGVSDEELWALTNRLLASRERTTIRMPGEEMLSVVRLNQAALLARIESLDEVVSPSDPPAGFVSTIVPVQHQPLNETAEALKQVLSAQHAAVQPVGEGDLLMADLQPRVVQAMELLERLDVPGEQPIVEIVPLAFRSATAVAPLITSAVTTRDAVMSAREKLIGKVTAMPSDDALLLVAPQSEVAYFRGLIERFDQRPAIQTLSYAPRYFTAGEVRGLIEQTAKEAPPRGSGEQWKVVTDELTGTLIVTATENEHTAIESLIDRLNDMPAEARRPVRTFEIRNRKVGEIRDLLLELIEAGVLDSPAPEGGEFESSISSPAAPNRMQGRSPPSNVVGELPRGQTQSGGQDNGGATPVQPAPTTPDQDAAAPMVQDGDVRATERVGGLTLTIDEGTNTLIAIGEPRVLAQIEALIEELDVRQPQVMLEVLLISLNESDTLDLGVQLEKLEMSGSTLISLSSLFGLGSTSGLTTLPAPGTGFTGVALDPGDFSIVLRALETINEGRSLNIPKVLVNNNQTATLDSVLQEPFVSTNASDTVATTSFGGTQDAGTQITVTPQIAAGDFLNLEYSVTLSAFVGDSSDPAIPPPRQENALSSQATIPDGYTIVVGGLEVLNESEAISQVPVLGSIPWLGEAFKSRSRTTSRNRFYVFIRPTVLRHDGFEDLKYLSDVATFDAGVDDGWPEVKPRIIR